MKRHEGRTVTGCPALALFGFAQAGLPRDNRCRLKHKHIAKRLSSMPRGKLPTRDERLIKAPFTAEKPAGDYVALEAITNLHELWVMQNFLPEEALAQVSP